MQLTDIQYSIIQHLRAIPGIVDVLWFYNGLTLTDRVKPFFVVENMQESGEKLAAGRDAYQETFRFQVGIYADSQNEINRKAQEAKQILRKQITLLDTSQQQPSAAGFFYADPGDIVPVKLDDPTDVTSIHRSYIDVTVEIIIQDDGTIRQ